MQILLNKTLVKSCLLLSLLVCSLAHAGASSLGEVSLLSQKYDSNVMTTELDNIDGAMIDFISIDLGNYFTDDVVDIFDSSGNQFHEEGMVYSINVATSFNGKYELEWVFSDPNTGEALDIIGYVGEQTQTISINFSYEGTNSVMSKIRLPIVGGGDYNISFPVTLSPVSEPSSLMMGVTGLVLLGGLLGVSRSKEKIEGV